MNTKYFKTVCLIMVIFGVLGVANNIGSVSRGMDIIAVALALFNHLLSIVAGVVGGKAAKTGDTDKAPLCRKLSYALLTVAAISFVVGIVTSIGVAVPGMGENLMLGLAIVIGLVGLILPVLYFLGAKKLGE